MSEDYGFTLVENQPNQNHPVLKAEHFKPGTIKVGEASVPVGGILAREISSGHYKKLGTLTQVTNENLTITPEDNNGKYAIGFQTANKPLLPGTPVVHCNVAGSPATLTDNGKGILSEASNKAHGNIDYGSGRGSVHTFTAMVSATDASVTASYKHFGNAGELDLEDLCVNALSVKDATSEAKKASLLDKGIINPARTTPVITTTDPLQVNLLRKSGIRIEEVDGLI